VTMRRIEIDKNRLLSWGDRYRIYLLFAVIFLIMAIFAPRFLTIFNLTTILRTTALHGTIAIGFTIVMICGQLDLSIGRIATFSAVLAMLLQPQLGFWLSVPLAVAAGAGIGLINGLLVAKAKIHSFIVTIGTMTILQGLVFTISGGNTVSLASQEAFAASDFLSNPVIPLLPVRVVIFILLVLGFDFLLKKSRPGRNFYLTGGNRTTAWLAGIKTDRVLIGAFVISGTMAAAGGVLFAMETMAATLYLGENSLMYVVSATIIGGTIMSGGKGGVLKTAVAVLTLEMLYTGVVLFGLGNEVKIFISGLVLAVVVLYEAYAMYKHEKIIGQRPELIRELERKKEKG